ncbi:Calcium-binding protein 39-like [Candida viswanathii]|uniref:Calcium-binding protein 39-like n=1 Tax=Candida viswanathii TaxID=5486 RepID=A0A367YQT0_9ASCO|nr:Calcium-binding protein 39-like [Candida viswanathii]
MAFLFKRNPKTPSELVRALNDQVLKLDYTSPQDNNYKKYQDECSRYLKNMKVILHGDDEVDPQPDQITQIAQEVYATDCLFLLISNLRKLDFDSRKDVVILFLTLLRRTMANKSPTVDYLINTKPEIIVLLIKGPEIPEIGLITGQILRDCIKFEIINRYVIYNPLFWNFFKYVQIPTFEIATDAMMTLHELLTTHKKLVSDFLGNNYEVFMMSINKLITSKNYVTKRQSVKLLNELVSQRSNQQFLSMFFDDANNLKLTMLLLSDKLKNLQLEGFNTLKFFVANPKRSQKVTDILIKNKENFIEFFKTFDISSFHDNHLIDERDYTLEAIKNLPDRVSH